MAAPAPFTQEQRAILLDAAGAAPSIHNTQPWLFEVHADRVEVRVDHRQALPVADPVGRQRTISCGAAVFNLRLAMAQLGYGSRVEATPRAEEPALLAAVARGPARPSQRWERTFYQVLYRRHTNRGAYRTLPVPPQRVAALVAAAAAEGGKLHPIARSDVPGSPT